MTSPKFLPGLQALGSQGNPGILTRYLDEVMACADTCAIPEWNCPKQLYPPYFPQSLGFPLSP